MKANRPKIVTLCGTSRFVDVMAVCAWLLERDEKVITMGLHLLPCWYGDIADHLAEAEGVAAEMDELHLRKIEMSDEIFVVDCQGYVGKSTKKEIEFAYARGKQVRYYATDLIGTKTQEILEGYLKRQKYLEEYIKPKNETTL